MLTAARFTSRYDRTLPGIRERTLVTNPAAGADWTVTVPGGQQWRILAMRHKLVTSAAVANRFPSLQFTVQGSIVFNSVATTAITASLTYSQSLFPGAAAVQSANSSTQSGTPIPDVWLPPTSIIATNTVNIDVADQWSAIALFIEKLYVTDQDLGDIASGDEGVTVFDRKAS